MKKTIIALVTLVYGSYANSYEMWGTVKSIANSSGTKIQTTLSTQRMIGPKSGKAIASNTPQANDHVTQGGSRGGKCRTSGSFRDSTGLIHSSHTQDCGSSITRAGGGTETCTCYGDGTCKISY